MKSEFSNYFDSLLTSTVQTLSECYVKDSVYLLDSVTRPKPEIYYEVRIDVHLYCIVIFDILDNGKLYAQYGLCAWY